MTRKDYELVANVLGAVEYMALTGKITRADKAYWLIKNALMREFRKENPRFSPEAFDKYIQKISGVGI